DDLPASEVLQVHVDAAALLADVVSEAATAPALDLGEATGFAADDLGEAAADLLGAVGVDIGLEDVNRFVLSGAVRARDCSAHAVSSWPRAPVLTPGARSARGGVPTRRRASYGTAHSNARIIGCSVPAFSSVF